jgi:hypothetical protein
MAFTEVASADVVTKAQKIGPNQSPILLERRVDRGEEGRAFSALANPGKVILHCRKIQLLNLQCSNPITNFCPQNHVLWVNFRVHVKPRCSVRTARHEQFSPKGKLSGFSCGPGIFVLLVLSPLKVTQLVVLG